MSNPSAAVELFGFFVELELELESEVFPELFAAAAAAICC
jgi:hypothetical protein